MDNPLWALAGLAAAILALAGCLALRARRGRGQETPVTESAAPARDYHLPPTIEAAEREMAVLLRRMRAYLHDPYDFNRSRITSEAAFEDCLDRAAALGCRIAELGGAAPPCQAERDRTRGLILDSLLMGRRRAPTGKRLDIGHPGPAVPARPSARAVTTPSTRMASAQRSSAAGRAA